MSKAAAKFIGTLLHSGTVAHIMHFQTRSFSQHMALGEFYDEIIDLVDAVAEAYQGKYGIITGYNADVFTLPKGEPVGYLQDLSSFVATNRDFCDDSEIQNLIDSVADQIDSTMYKLKFLS
jgi:hypothetical protein